VPVDLLGVPRRIGCEVVDLGDGALAWNEDLAELGEVKSLVLPELRPIVRRRGVMEGMVQIEAVDKEGDSSRNHDGLLYYSRV